MELLKENQSLYVANMEAIKQYKEPIAKMMRGGSIDQNIRAYEIEGQVCFKYKQDDKEYYLTATKDPRDTARDIIEEQYKNDKINIDKYTYGTLFITDPYLLEAFFNKYSWYKHVFTIFPSLDFFNTMLYYYDFSKFLECPAFKPIIFNGIENLEMNMYMNMAMSDFAANSIKIFAFSPFPLIANLVMLTARSIVKEVALMEQSNVSTMMLFGKDFFENDFRSIDKFIKYPDISMLKNTKVGKPVVCVAAGPSLKKNIEFLKKIQNEVFIIAVSAVLKPLLANGVRPDLVTTLDMHKEVAQYLENLDLTGIRIVAEMSCFYGVMENIKADYIISVASTTSRTYISLLLKALGVNIKDEQKIGGSMTVAFMSILVASLMGASKMILLGQDLAYEDVTHIDGATFANKLVIFQQNGEDYFKFDFLGDREDVILPVKWVKGYYKEKVSTTIQFDIYRQFLERLIKGRGYDIVNSTEGGCYIEGAEHLTLEEAYEKYIKPFSADKTLDIPRVRDYDFNSLPESIKNLEHLRDRYCEVLDITEKGLKEIENYEELRKDEEQSLKNKRKMDKLAGNINSKIELLLEKYKDETKYIAQFNPVGDFLHKYIDNINSSAYSENDKIVDMKNKAIIMFASIKEGCEMIIGEFERMLGRIRKEYL